MKYLDVNTSEYGFDAGAIIDGEVWFDEQRNEYVLKTPDGLVSIQDLLRINISKKVRLTCISFESMQAMERMLISQEKNELN